MEEKTKANNPSNRRIWLTGGLIGFAVGAIVCLVAIFAVMPSLMIVTKESKLSLDETVARLEESIVANGWVHLGTRDMNKSLAKHGIELKPRVRLVELCHSEYAKSILLTDRYIATMMPCTFAVWEGDNGKVYLSEMNMGLMAKLFGGNIAKVMGGKVVEDEHRILSGLLKD